MGTNTPAARVAQLTKRYGSLVGVEDVSFEVNPGEVLGFLGPNGSGKTTVIRVLAGLLSPTSGTAELFGQDVTTAPPSVRSRLGYLPGSLSLYGHMTAGEHLRFLARMRGTDCTGRIAGLAERLGLDLARRVDDMSKGNKQKVGVVQAFMHDPDLLIMDEPTSGLDPLVQREFDDMLSEATARGAAVLLSSHVMGEVERLASRVAIINKGRLVAFDDVRVLRDRLTHSVTLEFATPVDTGRLTRVPGFLITGSSGNRVTGTVRGPQTELLRMALGMGLVSVHSPEPSLDDLFISLVNGEKT